MTPMTQTNPCNCQVERTNKPLTLKLLAVIVDRGGQTNRVTDILKEERVRFHFITLGEGTAGSDIMTLLGLDTVGKSLICCVMPDFQVEKLLPRISDRLQLRKPGKGIAFVISLTGVNNSVVKVIENDVQSRGEVEKMENIKSASKYDMIVAIVNQGHVDDVMDAAKAAGARGGTVLHGRKVGVEEDTKFLGISVQLEKDIVAILTNHEKKNDIMRSVTQSCGLSTEAQGVIIALPVDEIEGLGSVKVSDPVNGGAG